MSSGVPRLPARQSAALLPKWGARNFAVVHLLLRLCAGAAIGLSGTHARAWGPEGHSIVAEIAQRRLSPAAAAGIEAALGRGVSLASVASWADEIRESRPATANWHFVNIPRGAQYDAARDCVPGPRGDCVVAALERLRKEIACAAEPQQRRDALRFAVHLVGDLHQPLHTVAEERGGNGLLVSTEWRGLACTGRCSPKRTENNFHVVWDSTLITSTVWNWGAYVDRLEEGWLRGADTSAQAAGTPAAWADETRALGQQVWDAMPASRVLGDDYYKQVLPVLDRQLGVAGLRLARYLGEVYAAPACAAR